MKMTRNVYIAIGEYTKTSTEADQAQYGIEIYEQDSEGCFYVCAFGGRRNKPDLYCSYRSADARQRSLANWRANIVAKAAAKKTKKAPSEQAQAAKLIRAWLKAKGIKGAVSSSSASMTTSVNVTVFDQPPAICEAVKAYCSQYQYGHFDGMQDLYECSNARDDIPQAKWVSVHNEYSAELQQAAWTYLRGYYAGGDALPENYTDGGNARLFDEYAQQRCYRILSGSTGQFWPTTAAASV